MPKSIKPQLKPRKTPVQARSNASVEAICEATIQVLLKVGKERLTTTKVAARAGVSVGTLYQYFPNKSSLLQAVLRRHMENVYGAIAAACESAKEGPLEEMAEALVRGFLAAKLKDVETSRALYLLSGDVGGAEIVRRLGEDGITAVVAMLESSGARFSESVPLMASTAMAAMVGVGRTMLEAGNAPENLKAMQKGLEVMVRAYLHSCAVSAEPALPKVASGAR